MNIQVYLYVIGECTFWPIQIWHTQGQMTSVFASLFYWCNFINQTVVHNLSHTFIIQNTESTRSSEYIERSGMLWPYCQMSTQTVYTVSVYLLSYNSLIDHSYYYYTTYNTKNNKMSHNPTKNIGYTLLYTTINKIIIKIRKQTVQ